MDQGKLTNSTNQFVDRCRAHAVRGLLIILAGTVAALACTWSLVTDRSVRFNSYRHDRGFYRLPPLPIMYDKENGKQFSVADLNESFSDEGWERTPSDQEQDVPPADALWERARTAIERKDVLEAGNLLQRFINLTDPPINDFRERRRAARDMLDALPALSQGSRPEAVLDYLKARLAVDEGTENGLLESTETSETKDRNLRDNWDYLRAAKLYISNAKASSREAFTAHIKKYPASEKNEAAMYMLAKIIMESSHSFENTACGIQGRTEWGEPVDPAKGEETEKCRDENWQSAINAFQQLMSKYPKGKYVDDSRGWLAYLYRRGSNRAEALAEYYRMLGHPSNWAVRIEAKKSLQMLGHEYDDETLNRVEKLIEEDADAAMAYAYHRIYNHATDLTYVDRNLWCCSGEDAWQQDLEETKRVEDAHNAGNHELERIARFATAIMKRNPRVKVSGGFILRVAQAQLELQNFKDARDLAVKAIQLGVAGDLRAEALWVKGSAEHQKKELAASRQTLELLVSEFPKSKLNAGARRLLAMIAEDRGDLESALNEYISLDYRYDVAYFVDVLMPTERLAKFVANRPNHELHDEFLYSLGVRYMRERRWDEARTTFSKVRTTPAAVRYDFDDSTRSASKDPYSEERRSYTISNDWVMLDLKTIDVLESMEGAVDSSPDDESKAEAMYQLAGFFFAADDLLFYNPAAWRGMRADLLYDLQYGRNMRLPEESQIIFNHSQEHDTFARAIPIYIEIANRFPNTRAAKDALYSAAVAHERLSNINDYWREAYERNLFAGSRLVTYADVKSTYPRYQLPRGTDRWEPATRTVNGRPGWAPPPRTLPRETKEQKIKRLLREAATTVSDYSNKALPKVENKVDAGIDWYKSGIEAAVYGIFAGIGLWIIILVGIGLHARRNSPVIVTKIDEQVGAESRVDKFL